MRRFLVFAPMTDQVVETTDLIEPTSDRFTPLIFSALTPGKRIHMIRTGTFTDSLGREYTFTSDHIQAMAQNFATMQPKRDLPITEGHDWGRAVGRLTRAWSPDGEHLYGTPVWNSAGQQLLTDGVYDGFSCEIDHVSDLATICLIGGSLTNYPAVSGLQPVTLQAPVDAIDDLTPQPEEITMPDEAVVTSPTTEPATDVAALIASAFQSANLSGAMTESFRSLFTQQMQAQIDAARDQARLEAQRSIAEFQAQQQIASFAQHITTPTLSRPTALPLEATRIEKFLFSLSGDSRKEGQAILEHILTAGLVSFSELGATGDATQESSAIERYEEAVATEIKNGAKSRSAALSAVQRAHPDLVAAYNTERAKGGK